MGWYIRDFNKGRKSTELFLGLVAARRTILYFNLKSLIKCNHILVKKRKLSFETKLFDTARQFSEYTQQKVGIKSLYTQQ